MRQQLTTYLRVLAIKDRGRRAYNTIVSLARESFADQEVFDANKDGLTQEMADNGSNRT
jgi:hypothetical protein